jgi:hypothetical protein
MKEKIKKLYEIKYLAQHIEKYSPEDEVMLAIAERMGKAAQEYREMPEPLSGPQPRPTGSHKEWVRSGKQVKAPYDVSRETCTEISLEESMASQYMKDYGRVEVEDLMQSWCDEANEELGDVTSNYGKPNKLDAMMGNVWSSRGLNVFTNPMLDYNETYLVRGMGLVINPHVMPFGMPGKYKRTYKVPKGTGPRIWSEGLKIGKNRHDPNSLLPMLSNYLVDAVKITQEWITPKGRRYGKKAAAKQAQEATEKVQAEMEAYNEGKKIQSKFIDDIPFLVGKEMQTYGADAAPYHIQVCSKIKTWEAWQYQNVKQLEECLEHINKQTPGLEIVYAICEPTNDASLDCQIKNYTEDPVSTAVQLHPLEWLVIVRNNRTHRIEQVNKYSGMSRQEWEDEDEYDH